MTLPHRYTVRLIVGLGWCAVGAFVLLHKLGVFVGPSSGADFESKTTMTLNIDAVRSKEFSKLVEVFQRHGYEIRLCGGVVRDLLLGNKPTDVDFATEASVGHIKSIVKDAGFDTKNPDGEKTHGTVTILVDDKKFEVTTLYTAMEDVNMDRWETDARHRDFTVNAMFLGLDGTLYDYVGGRSDLKKGIVRFVGDPSPPTETNRQKRFYYILRYFRFQAQLSNNASDHDQTTLDLIRKNANGLRDSDGPRLWYGFKKLLQSRNSHLVLPAMESTGVTKHLGLPDTINIEEYRAVYTRTRRSDPSACTMVSALLTNQSQVETLHARLHLSTTEKAICDFIIRNRGNAIRSSPVTYFNDTQYKNSKLDGRTLKVCLGELLRYGGHDSYLGALKQWQPR